MSRTTREDISRWFARGVERGSAFMIVACDTFSYEDYPVFVDSTDDFKEEYDKVNGRNMQKVMEVYDFSMDAAKQLSQHRAFNFPTGFVRS